MTLYARKDVQSISVPVTSGGCGQSHQRGTDVYGVPNELFQLDCPGCELFLKGGGRTLLRTTPGDKELGIAPSQERVADLDPCWAAHPEEVPPTRDDLARQLKFKTTIGREQGLALSAGLRRMLEGDADTSLLTMVGKSVQGMVVCPRGHANTPGNSFCGQCGSVLRHTEIAA